MSLQTHMHKNCVRPSIYSIFNSTNIEKIYTNALRLVALCRLEYQLLSQLKTSSSSFDAQQQNCLALALAQQILFSRRNKSENAFQTYFLGGFICRLFELVTININNYEKLSIIIHTHPKTLYILLK